MFLAKCDLQRSFTVRLTKAVPDHVHPVGPKKKNNLYRTQANPSRFKKNKYAKEQPETSLEA